MTKSNYTIRKNSMGEAGRVEALKETTKREIAALTALATIKAAYE